MPEKKCCAGFKCRHTGKQSRAVPASPSKPNPNPEQPEQAEKPENPEKPEKPERWWVTRWLDILKILIGLANLILGLFKH